MPPLNAVRNWQELLLDEQPPVSANPFAYIPHDVLQTMSCFLCPMDRATFNQVVEPQERVYKSFGAEGADAHHVKTIQMWYNDWALKYQTACQVGHRKKERSLIKSIYENIILKPTNHIIFQYKEGLATQLMDIFVPYLHDPEEVYGKTYLRCDHACLVLTSLEQAFQHYLVPRLIRSA